MIQIRQAGKQDAADIARISQQTFAETFASSNTPENMDKFFREQFSLELLEKEVTAPGNIFLLAEEEQTILGYARLRLNNIPPTIPDKNAIELSRIYALKNAIGKGVGKALMEETIRLAEENNKSAIWLGVWEKNETAIRFYEKWGFEKFDDHIFLLGDDPQNDWLMIKKVKS